jgi:LicD family
MALDEVGPARKAAIKVHPVAGSASNVTISGHILLSDQDVAPFRVQVIGNGKIKTADTSEMAENSRAVRRGKTTARRLLRVEPLAFDLTKGPAQLLFQAGTEEPRILTTIELPGPALARLRKLLDQELAAGLLQKHTLRRSARLDAAFSELQDNEDDPDWLETMILINSIRRTRPNRTRGAIGRLRDQRASEGKPHLFADFMGNLTDRHGLPLPNGHGYGGSFAHRDRAAVWKGISDVIAHLRGMGLTVFLNSGTLLGAVREGDLLGHDDDIDLAVLISGRSQEEAAEAWLDLRRKLSAKGLEIEATRRSGVSILKLPPIEGVQVDLFPAWIDGAGKLYIYPHTAGGLKRADLLPLKPGPFAGTWIPARAERVLEQNYGPNWRVPDTTFRFPWHETAIHFRPFMSALRLALGPFPDDESDDAPTDGTGNDHLERARP